MSQYRQVPTYEQPLLHDGKHTGQVWYRYFQDSEAGRPPAAETVVTPTASPFVYTAPRAGNLLVSGGTVGTISLSRSGTFLGTGRTVGMFRMAQGDQAKITYTVAPTVVFFPV
jgi:hypothetical protein